MRKWDRGGWRVWRFPARRVCPNWSPRVVCLHSWRAGTRGLMGAGRPHWRALAHRGGKPGRCRSSMALPLLPTSPLLLFCMLSRSSVFLFSFFSSRNLSVCDLIPPGGLRFSVWLEDVSDCRKGVEKKARVSCAVVPAPLGLRCLFKRWLQGGHTQGLTQHVFEDLALASLSAELCFLEGPSTFPLCTRGYLLALLHHSFNFFHV